MRANAVDGVCETETVHQTFRFHRYHAELLRRKSQEAIHGQAEDGFDDNCPLDGNSLLVKPQSTTDSSNAMSERHNDDNKDISNNQICNAFASIPSSTRSTTNNILENLVNCTIVLDENGNINPAGGSPDKKHHHPTQVDLQTTLLLRNIQNSRIVIQNSLPALHIVNVYHTQIHVHGVVESAIQVTKAIDSHLVIIYPARQLRIHQAIRLNITLGDSTVGNGQPKDDSQSTTKTTTRPSAWDGWNPGSIILEHSKHVTFYVPIGDVNEGSSSHVTNASWMSIIKDFGWLRTSAPSPNYSVQGIDASASQKMIVHCQQVQGIEDIESCSQATNSAVSASNLNILSTTSHDNDEDDHYDDDEL
jgi:hypothetical protein